METATNSPVKELVCSFPIDTLMSVLHIDGYSVGANLNFAGDKGFLIALCGMYTFVVVKPVGELITKDYAQALIMLMLSFGIAHTIALDADKKFSNIFRLMCGLLNLNVHFISGGNHDLMLVKQVNNYLNKGVRIFTQE